MGPTSVAIRDYESDTVHVVVRVQLIPVYIGLMFGTCVGAANLTS
jgi:hypothetical protein